MSQGATAVERANDAGACEECGYALRGLSRPEGPRVCPECGSGFDPERPWTPAPWPTRVSLWFRLCGPAFAWLGLMIAASAAPPVRALVVWPLWTVWVGGIVLAAVIWPISASRELARSREPRATRREAARRAWAPARALNLAASAAALMAFFAML